MLNNDAEVNRGELLEYRCETFLFLIKCCCGATHRLGAPVQPCAADVEHPHAAELLQQALQHGNYSSALHAAVRLYVLREKAQVQPTELSQSCREQVKGCSCAAGAAELHASDQPV